MTSFVNDKGFLDEGNVVKLTCGHRDASRTPHRAHITTVAIAQSSCSFCQPAAHYPTVIEWMRWWRIEGVGSSILHVTRHSAFSMELGSVSMAVQRGSSTNSRMRECSSIDAYPRGY